MAAGNGEAEEAEEVPSPTCESVVAGLDNAVPMTDDAMLCGDAIILAVLESTEKGDVVDRACFLRRSKSVRRFGIVVSFASCSTLPDHYHAVSLS